MGSMPSVLVRMTTSPERASRLELGCTLTTTLPESSSGSLETLSSIHSAGLPSASFASATQVHATAVTRSILLAVSL